MPGFTGLTTELCDAAFDIIKPAIDVAMTDGVVKRSHGCLVVLNPQIPREPKYKQWSLDPEDPFEGLVLFEHKWGNEANWEHPYQAVARSKAFASWKTGLPTHLLQVSAPYLYEPGWTKYPGSAVGPGGFVDAFSGVESYFDRMFAEWMLSACVALCMDELHGEFGVMADESVTFLGMDE